MKTSYKISQLCLTSLLICLFLQTSFLPVVSAGGLEPYLETAAKRDMSWWVFDETIPYSTVTDSSLNTVILLNSGSFNTQTDKKMNIPDALTAHSLKSDQSGMFLVQFKGPISETHKAAVVACGAKLYDYVPNFTFIAMMTNEQAEKIEKLNHINWVGRFHPAYRIHSSFGTRDLRLMERIQSDRFSTLITVLEPGNLAEVSDQIEKSGGLITSVHPELSPPFVTAEIYPESVFSLAHIETIRRIEENGEFYTLNDETQEVLQSGSVAGGTPIWDAGIHGEGQIIGHMDSGIDPDHCFFYDQSQPLPGSTPNFNHRKIVAYRVYADGEAYDKCENGHGTHTSGTAAGFTMNPAGIEYIGLAYAAKITAADVGKDDWLGCYLGLLSVPSDLTGIYSDAYGDGARIHTNSWGSTDNTYDAMSTQTDTFMWDNKDFLIFYANGNSGPNAGTMGTPATSKNIVAVGGSNNEPDQNQIWESSSRGPVNGSNRMAPALMAPSTDGSGYTGGIDSSASDGTTGSENCGFIGQGYQGTSMACPAAAACGILVRQYFADGYYPTGSSVPGNAFLPSAALVKAVMINGAVDMTGGVAHRPNNDQGWGRVHLDNSLYIAGDTSKLNVLDDTNGLATGSEHDTLITINSNSVPLRITLDWTDVAGNSLVNDLDLELIKDTQTWYGNNFVNGWTSTGTTQDHNLPTECIFINTTDLVPGNYTVRVRAYNVPQGEAGGLQPYALVISGDLVNDSTCNNDGDANLNGEITSSDAQLAFQIVLGTYSPGTEEECAADCNGDSEVTSGDAQRIFQVVLGSNSCVDPM